MFIEVLAVGCVDILLVLTDENFGIEQITGETLPNFRQESSRTPSSYAMLMLGHVAALAEATEEEVGVQRATGYYQCHRFSNRCL
ncbi:hypothetical protein L3X38_025956 [Prunus dulcis]|uniref:Uncharacterized protein n=1 Tax=Prunus dulcis TaxID=3755 RepID=A0AAD4W5E4_PRUDU|nr:hypothetical protein L3X38_025956 [Prunus dulcis]